MSASVPKTNRNFYLIIIVVGMGLALRMGVNIWKVYRSGQRIIEAQNALNQAQVEHQELEKRLSYVQTSEFVEKEAREKLGYGREGETVLIMPKFSEKPKEAEEVTLPAWKQWRKLYLGI